MSALSIVGGNTANDTASGPWANEIGYMPLSGGMNGSSIADEATAAMHSAAGTWSMMSVNIISSSSGVATATFRKNGSNGNQSVGVSSGATGWFVDSSDADATSNGDLVAIEMNVTNTLTFVSYVSAFDSGTANAVGWFGQSVVANTITGGPSGDTFNGFGGQWFNGQDSVEANVQIKLNVAGTFSHFEVYENQATTWTFRLNGANGNQNLPATTGAQIDNTNTDAASIGDLFCANAGAAQQAWARMSVRFSSSGASCDLGGVGFNVSQNTSGWVSILSQNVNNTGWCAHSEAAAQTKVPFASTFAALRFYLSQAGGATQLQQQFRVNGANGNQVVLSTFASTGWFQDVSNTDSVAAGALVNMVSTVPGPSDVNLNGQAITFNATPAGPTTAVGTASGAGAAAAVATDLQPSVGFSAGVGVAISHATGILPSVGTAAGMSGVVGVGNVLGVLEPLFDWEATVISQYQTSPTLLQLIENMETYIDPLTNLDAFYVNIWNIYSASGYGLDVWGRIVGVTRTIRVPTPHQVPRLRERRAQRRVLRLRHPVRWDRRADARTSRCRIRPSGR